MSAGRREQHLDVVAEPDVLRPLADVEAHDRRSLARIAAVNLEDEVFDAEPRQALPHRRPIEDRDLCPSIRTCASVSSIFGSGLPRDGM